MAMIPIRPEERQELEQEQMLAMLADYRQRMEGEFSATVVAALADLRERINAMDASATAERAAALWPHSIKIH